MTISKRVWEFLQEGEPGGTQEDMKLTRASWKVLGNAPIRCCSKTSMCFACTVLRKLSFPPADVDLLPEKGHPISISQSLATSLRFKMQWGLNKYPSRLEKENIILLFVIIWPL